MTSALILYWACAWVSILGFIGIDKSAGALNKFSLFAVIMAFIMAPCLFFPSFIYFIVGVCGDNFSKINPTVWRRK